MQKLRAETVLQIFRQSVRDHQKKREHDYYQFQSDSYYKRPRTDGRGRNKKR